MNKRRVILSSLSGAIILSVASISFSIAWYASGGTARVQYVDIDLNTDEKLLISTSDEVDSFRSHLDYEDLKHNIGVFVPVSLVYRSNWVDEKLDHPLFYDCSQNMSTSGVTNTAATSGFYMQELYLYSEDDVYVSIDKEGTKIVSDINKNKALADEIYTENEQNNIPNEYTREEIADRLANLTNAMRYMILNPDVDNYSYAVIDPNKNQDETYLAGTLDNNIDTYYDYARQNVNDELKEIVYGEVNDRSLIVYDEVRSEDSPYEKSGEPSAFNAKHAKNVRPFSLEKSLANGLELQKEGAYTLDDLDGYAPKFEIPLKRYTPTKFVLCIYIEGWDLDSINHTMGASFLASLSFRITRRM